MNVGNVTYDTCDVCPHACRIRDDGVGQCRARGISDGTVRGTSYGRLTSIGLDPVRKKPLANWHPGDLLLSVGSYGCNMHCPFCQNHRISQVGEHEVKWHFVPPGVLVERAVELRDDDPRVIGIAHTYNEPLLAWAYVCDVGMLAHRVGLTNVLVSNGYANSHIIDKVAPLIDAANIDLKAFTEEYYAWCGGSLRTVQGTIERLAAEPGCHLEVTTLIISGHNDSPDEMRELSRWLASVDPSITLHVTRAFPQWKMEGAPATPPSTVYALAEIAREALEHVVVGNC